MSIENIGFELAGNLVSTVTTSAADADIPITKGIVAKTSGGDAETPAIADGTAGDLLYIYMATDGGGDATLTPVTCTGFSALVMGDAGDSVLLLYVDDSTGWIVLAANGVTITA